jgi:hypothetical protein
MPVGPVRTHGFMREISKRILSRLDGIIKIPASNFILSVKKIPMLSVFTTCTAMYGSGWRMTGTVITKVRLMTVVLGSMNPEAFTAFVAAAAGTTMRPAAGRRFAAATRPATATASSAFASPGPLPLALDPLDPWRKQVFRPGAAWREPRPPKAEPAAGKRPEDR